MTAIQWQTPAQRRIAARYAAETRRRNKARRHRRITPHFAAVNVTTGENVALFTGATRTEARVAGERWIRNAYALKDSRDPVLALREIRPEDLP